MYTVCGTNSKGVAGSFKSEKVVYKKEVWQQTLPPVYKPPMNTTLIKLTSLNGTAKFHRLQTWFSRICRKRKNWTNLLANSFRFVISAIGTLSVQKKIFVRTLNLVEFVGAITKGSKKIKQ